jgi:uncharacterized protein
MGTKALRSLFRVCIGAVVAYALVVTAVYAVQREIVFPRRFVNPAPFLALVGDQFERLTLETSDGEFLKAYWKPPVGDAPVIVSFHGNGSVPERLAMRFGRGVWADAGFGVLTFAYRGYPGSTGFPTEMGLIEDGETAIRFVQSHAPANPVVIHGYSLGTGVAVAVSERHKSLGLFLEAPFSSLPDVVSVNLPFLPNFLMQDTFASQRRIVASQATTIVISHGEQDRIVPAMLGRRLHASAPHGRFIAIMEADHMSLLGLRDAEILEMLSNGYPIEDEMIEV